MAKHSTGAEMPKMERKATVRVDVPKESKAKMDMKGMEMGKEMSMMCTGKISRMTDDEMGKSMEIEMSSMKMMGKEMKNETMGQAMERHKKGMMKE